MRSTVLFELTILFLPKWFDDVLAIDPNCDYIRNLVLGQEYFIYNQNYPNRYHPSTSCRWSAKSPPGTIIVLSCNEVDIPNSQNCQNDRLSVSTTGDQNFQNSSSFCGQTAFTVITQNNSLTVGLSAGGRSTGGKFNCSVAAMRLASRGCSCSYQQEKTKIVGGQETGVNEFPWMVGIVDTFERVLICGASIISDRYALTTAECLHRDTLASFGLVVGEHDVTTGSDTSATALYRISEFQAHPAYNSTDETNDVAVLRTYKPIRFSTAVGPVCLPFRYGTKSFEHDIVTVLGWGFTEFAGSKSNTLQKANLSVASSSDCAKALGRPIQVTQMCTYMQKKDPCIVDSGDPLLWRNSGNKPFELIGLLSYGYTCETRVNTRVTSFLSWIVSVTSDTLYCVK